MEATALLKRAFTAGTGKVFWDVTARSLSFLLSIVLARSLGAEGYGVYAVAWYAAWMCAQVTDLGLHIVTLRELSREWSPVVFTSALFAKIVLSLVLGAGFVGACLLGAVPNLTLVVLLLLASVLASWTEWLGVILRSRGHIAREGWVLAALRLGWLTLAGLALHRGAELPVVALSLACAGIPALALAVILLRRDGVRTQGASRAEVGRLLRDAMPLAVTTAITLIYLRVDLFILAALRDATEVGLFASAFRLFEASFVLSGGIAAGTFPLLAKSAGQRELNALARFVSLLLLTTSLPLASLFFFGGDVVVATVFGADFQGAALPLRYLGIALVAVFVNAATTHLLVATGRTRRLIYCMLLRLGVATGLDLLLIPELGGAGAAIAVAAGEWSLTVSSVVFAWDELAAPKRPHVPLANQFTSPVREEGPTCF